MVARLCISKPRGDYLPLNWVEANNQRMRALAVFRDLSPDDKHLVRELAKESEQLGEEYKVVDVIVNLGMAA
jgi:hypothetical protein